MPAKRQPARKRTTAARRTTTRGKHPARRVKIPRSGPVHARLGSWLMLRVVIPMVDTHSDTVRSRKDAAILRLSHEGCPKCGGKGQIHTKGKNGEFTGSKPCPANPTKQKVSKWAVHKAARFGPDKRAGLCGFSCPCGKQVKPRFRDAKEATKALRTHERQKHGGKSVGGRYTVQDTKAVPNTPAQQKPQQPVSKVVPNSGQTDKQWIARNKGMAPAKAKAAGYCWKCSGDGKIHAVFGDEQILVVCPDCQGNGKAKAAA